ncbi:MAG: hypothetical protein ACLP72_07370 [Candidatus Sulfotelmatobacter sp.]
MVGRARGVNHVRVVVIGWALGLALAAVLLPSPDFGVRPASGVIKGLLAILAIWITYTAVAVPLYFYRALRKVRDVPNKTEYVLWLGFEILCAVALTGGIIYSVLLRR